VVQAADPLSRAGSLRANRAAGNDLRGPSAAAQLFRGLLVPNRERKGEEGDRGLAPVLLSNPQTPEATMKTVPWILATATLVVSGYADRSRAATPAAPPATTIDIWVRGNGPTTGDAPPRGRAQSLNLDTLPLVEGERFDAQYEGKRVFRGIALASVIERFAPDPSLDLAILHFANGMAVPVPFRDAAAMKRLDPFIARGMETHRKGAVKTDFFTDIRKKGTMADARPIVFHGNKVVVAERWHPVLAAGAEATFSPWAHVDSLANIELVAAAPYYRQFEAGAELPVKAGLAVFQQTCQFCHGVRKVGAKFGWDFVDPTPLYSYRKPSRNLFYHIAYKPLDAAERGLMMPALKSMTEQDAAKLWVWMRAIATNPMAPYAAPAAGPTAKR
jgi:mono/diheme cytochrome c family protein